MPKTLSYSHYTCEAASLLGKLIKFGRKKRLWSEFDLAERAGIARDTVQRIEKGGPTCSLGFSILCGNIDDHARKAGLHPSRAQRNRARAILG